MCRAILKYIVYALLVLCSKSGRAVRAGQRCIIQSTDLCPGARKQPLADAQDRCAGAVKRPQTSSASLLAPANYDYVSR